jgi:hypothetical protein
MVTQIHRIQFDDAALFDSLPPDLAYAALYADGRYRVPADAMPRARKITHRRWITVSGQVAHAGIADFEPQNSVYDTPGMLRNWAAMRLTERKSIPIVYSDRADVKAAVGELGKLPAYHWIATLDQKQWTPEEIVANLRDEFGVTLTVGQIWANQFTDLGKIDVSNLFGNWWE